MDQTRKILKGESVSSGIAVAKAYTYEPLELNTCKIAFAKGMEREYFKQFNMDGTATLNVYALVENTEMPKEEDNLKMNDNYVTREEFNQVLNKLQSLFVKEEKKQSSNISF